MHVNAFKLRSGTQQSKTMSLSVHIHNVGLAPTIVESDNDSIEFYRGFAHGATSSLPWTPVPQLAQSSDLPNITVLDFFKACNPLNQ